jgi:hypothetical protein
MKALISLSVILFCLSSNATVVSITPKNPVVLFVNRYILNQANLYAPNTIVQFEIDNSQSSFDLVIGDILVMTNYTIDGFGYQATSENVIPFNFNSSNGQLSLDTVNYTIGAGQKTILGSSPSTIFAISNMLSLNGAPYFGNSYNAVIGNSFNVIVVGYYVDQLGQPVQNFKEEVRVNFTAL